jgi:uncharacterized Fe-S cluster protein YjdI
MATPADDNRLGRAYAAPEVTVFYDRGRCRHYAECVRGLPQVFDPTRRPWIRADLADPNGIAEVVRRCPTGALHYRLLAAEPEEPTHPTVITPDPRGPLLVRGDLVLDTPEGPLLFRTAARTGRPRLTGALVGWYLLVALLHTLWDASRPVAVWLTLLLTATQVQWLLIRMGRVPQPTQAQVHTFTTLTWGLLLLDALLGVAVLRGRWRQALALERVQPAPRPTP